MVLYWDVELLFQMVWAFMIVELAVKISSYHLFLWQKIAISICIGGISVFGYLHPGDALFLVGIEWLLLLLLIRNIVCVTQIFMVTILAGGVRAMNVGNAWYVWFFLFIGGYLVLKYFQKSDLYTVTMEKNGKKITLKALYDSGNRLVVPEIGKGVSLVYYPKIESLFDWEKVEGAVFIPYRSVGNENGSLLAIPVDRLIISEKNMEIKHHYVGIVYQPLCENRCYDMILHSDVW